MLPEIDRVTWVYSGKQGCCCGCNGKYTYASAHRQASEKQRGYSIADEEVNDRIVKVMRTKIRQFIADGYHEIDFYDNQIVVNIENCFGKRTYMMGFV